MQRRGRGAAIEMRQRFAVVAGSWIVIVQAFVAASLAYLIAEAIGHETPFFAPIAAVATVAVSLANRLRRAAGLVIGNAVGILFADILIAQIGSGAWQIGLVVALSLIAAIMLGGGLADPDHAVVHGRRHHRDDQPAHPRSAVLHRPVRGRPDRWWHRAAHLGAAHATGSDPDRPSSH